jgi:hypothetical protein
MQAIRGRVASFLSNGSGQIKGLVLDDGIEVRFSPDESSRVSLIVGIGSPVEIHGWTRPGPMNAMRFDASAIKNCESNRIVFFENLPLPRDTEVPPPFATREEAASLPSLPGEQRAHSAATAKSLGLRKRDSAATAGEDSLAPHTLRPWQNHPSEPAASFRWTNGDEAAREIEAAYDGLHRTQAILAYVKIVDLKDPDVGRLLEEARQTYQHALLSHQNADFTVAGELAAASRNLSAAVEAIVSRIFRSSSNFPTLVPPPPLRLTSPEQSAQVLDRILRTQKSLARIRWVLENGTMPQEDVEEVQEIADWCEGFFRQAQRAFHAGGIDDSAGLAETAYAIAQAAEHICKKCYVSHDPDFHASVAIHPSD